MSEIKSTQGMIDDYIKQAKEDELRGIMAQHGCLDIINAKDAEISNMQAQLNLARAEELRMRTALTAATEEIADLRAAQSEKYK